MEAAKQALAGFLSAKAFKEFKHLISTFDRRRCKRNQEIHEASGFISATDARQALDSA